MCKIYRSLLIFIIKNIFSDVNSLHTELGSTKSGSFIHITQVILHPSLLHHPRDAVPCPFLHGRLHSSSIPFVFYMSLRNSRTHELEKTHFVFLCMAKTITSAVDVLFHSTQATKTKVTLIPWWHYNLSGEGPHFPEARGMVLSPYTETIIRHLCFKDNFVYLWVFCF